MQRVRLLLVGEIIESHFLARPHGAGGEEGQDGKTLAVVPRVYRHRPHIGVARVVREAPHIPALCGVDTVDPARQVKHVRGACGIAVAALRHAARAHILAVVVANKGARRYLAQRADPPASVLARVEDFQAHARALRDHAVRTQRATAAEVAALGHLRA